MKTKHIALLVVLFVSGAVVLADEGMWRINQLPLDVIAAKYGVQLTPADLRAVRYAQVSEGRAGGAEGHQRRGGA